MLLCVGIACAGVEAACSSGLVGMCQTLSVTMQRITMVCNPPCLEKNMPWPLRCKMIACPCTGDGCKGKQKVLMSP